jgi:DNA-directed RNA polymerase subunit RPC12/RpoP
MDILFKCPNCNQELEVDSSASGSTIECPACSNSITIPPNESAPAPVIVTVVPDPPAAAPAEDHRPHFSVPVHDGPSEALISKPKLPLEVAARETDRKLRIKTFKRSDCQEVGRDHFDERVSEFLEKVGETNIVSINTIGYSFVDMGSHASINDYGVLIVFKG